MATADDDMICMITIEHVEAVNRSTRSWRHRHGGDQTRRPRNLDRQARPPAAPVLALMARAEPASSKAASIGGVARTRNRPIR
jgi:4-hydroxy-2-oxoheptanedioate aldolase